MNTNNKEVKAIVRDHIIKSITIETEDVGAALRSFYDQVKINQTGKMNLNNAIEYTISGVYEGFLYKNMDVLIFIDNLHLDNKKHKQYDIWDYWKLYLHLIARESIQLWKKYKII